MEVVRATREASRCPVTFWPHLVEHAVEALNRTTGPPHEGDSYASSHQIVTGEAPKILTILPVGCRAYAVKPVGSYVKSTFESRAWSGINLGRCSSIPNAYNIWLPEQHKVIQTSEVYFDESLFPWRPSGDQRVGTPSPTSAPTADPSDISAGGVTSNIRNSAAPTSTVTSSLPEAFASATREAHTRAYRATKLLLLFSGAYNRPDGLAQFARQSSGSKWRCSIATQIRAEASQLTSPRRQSTTNCANASYAANTQQSSRRRPAAPSRFQGSSSPLHPPTAGHHPYARARRSRDAASYRRNIDPNSRAPTTSSTRCAPSCTYSTSRRHRDHHRESGRSWRSVSA